MKLGIDTSVAKAHDTIMDRVKEELEIYGVNPLRLVDYEEAVLYAEVGCNLLLLLSKLSEGE